MPNLERALELFELLSENPQGLKISEMSSILSFPRNSVFRIITTLNDTNYLFRDEESRTYRISPKMLNIGMKALNQPALVETALPVMHSLQKIYKETVPLGIIKYNKGIILEEVTGTHPFRFVLEPGKSFNLHTSAAAKAILAFLPDDEKESLLNTIKYTKYTDHTIQNEKDYIIELKKVKKQGYAKDFAEEVEGMHCLAAPIFNRTGYPVAAVWITGPSIRIHESDFDEIGREVRQHADKISKKLGFSGG